MRADLKPGESISGSVFRSGKVKINNARQEIERSMAALSSKNRALFYETTEGWGRPQSAVGLPLLMGERKIGVLIRSPLPRMQGAFKKRGNPSSQSWLALLPRP